MNKCNDKPLFIQIIAGLMALIFVVGVSTIIYERLKFGPPCDKIAESKYECFKNYK